MERKFGRLRDFDERSRNYPIRSMVEGLEPQTKLWPHFVILDQGLSAACVGHAIAGEISAEPISVPNIDHEFAMKIYHMAQKVDPWPGEDYEGTTTLAGMKVGKELGYYKGYRWAFTLDEIILGVSNEGPVVVGTNWYQGMENPDQEGFVTPSGMNLGGHCWLVNGNNLDGYFNCINSWGYGYGIQGTFKIAHDDLWYLMEHHGECCLPVGRKIPEVEESQNLLSR